VNLSETSRVLYQINLRNSAFSLAFIIRIYHDARSSECQIGTSLFVIFITTCFDPKRSSSGYDDPLGSKHVAIHTTVEIVLTVFTPLII
jgi:hypothetical protein